MKREYKDEDTKTLRRNERNKRRADRNTCPNFSRILFFYILLNSFKLKPVFVVVEVQ